MEIKLDLPDIEELEQEQPEAAEQVAKQVQPVPEEAPVAAPDPEQQEAPKPGSQTPDWLKPFRAPLPGEDRSGLMTTVMDTLAAPAVGMSDYVVDELNKLPFLNIQKRSEYSNEGVQAVRELSSIIGPFIALRRAAMKGGAGLQAKVKHPLGEKRLMKWFSELGIDTGVGAYVDYTNSINQYDDNMTGWLKKSWPKFWSFLPDDWATLPLPVKRVALLFVLKIEDLGVLRKEHRRTYPRHPQQLTSPLAAAGFSIRRTLLSIQASPSEVR